MKEHKSNTLKSNQYKNYILGLLLIVALLVIFIDLEFFQSYLSRNYQQHSNKNTDITHSEENTRISEIIPLVAQIDHINPKDSFDIRELMDENKDQKLIRELKNDDKTEILALILDYINNKDASEKILSLRNALVECPPEIKDSLDFLDDYNKKFIVNNINPSITIFPDKNNFLEKIFSPLFKVEKINNEKIKNQEILFKHIGSIIQYIITRSYIK
jgi:hypothetical protein